MGLLSVVDKSKGEREDVQANREGNAVHPIGEHRTFCAVRGQRREPPTKRKVRREESPPRRDEHPHAGAGKEYGRVTGGFDTCFGRSV